MNPSISYRRFDGIYRSGPTLHLRIINSLPAMLYHGVPRRRVPPELLSEGASFRAKAGVNTEPAVLMRMNAVPRSIATGLGDQFSATVKEGADLHSVRSARSHLCNPSATDWYRSDPPHALNTATQSTQGATACLLN
ncbi:MAG: hypothetical protein KJ072_24395 [Verrucomicrobia bacterium]|nr:hypothetical protein [Verrucomicrobiota bacterium]